MKIPERICIRLFRRIQHGQILNVYEGSRVVYRVQVRIKVVNTAVPQEQDEYRGPITNEADRNQGQRITVQRSECFLGENNGRVFQARDKS